MAKKLLIYLSTFILTLTLLWLTLLFTSMIPNEAIRENMLASAYNYDGAEPFRQDGERSSTADNYADVILLNIVWNIDSTKPLLSSLDTKYFNGNEQGENYGFYAALNGAEPNTDYTRYWHGMSAVIRPLMLVTDVNGIKKAGLAAALLLLGINCIILLKQKRPFAAAALFLSFAAVGIWKIGLSMEYQPAVIISLLMTALFILLEKKGDTTLIILSVISGTLIAFFDFLTAETLTILIPLLMIMIIRYDSGRFSGFRPEAAISLKCLTGWLCSYAFTFIAKWTAASLATGQNKFSQAMHSAEVRFTGGSAEISAPLQMILAPVTNISTLFGGITRADMPYFLTGIIVTALLTAVILYIFKSKKNTAKDFIFLAAALGILPLARFIVLNNHSYLHDFFTYRALASTVLALLASVWYQTLGTPEKKKVK
ncbi:MAG: hypothetical protein J6A37_05380 [Oscillospiraceae bacterium]|nr:hypothetical protein [Oscillospiraceae bacterium]